MAASANRQSYKNIALAVHGGCGVINSSSMTAAADRQYRKHLEAALKAGYQALQEHASSLDAVEEAIRYLEDCPIFNAGRGSLFTRQGTIELDAAIMDGCDAMAGAVACVTNIKNPITAARAVMEQTPQVLLVGKGAEQFARKFGLEMVDPSYFHTNHQWNKLQKMLQEEQKEAKRRGSAAPTSPASNSLEFVLQSGTANPKKALKKYGTVGAVAVDQDGNLAAATSTGGVMDQRYGRVGDSALIGAGTYADNNTCAVSATGQGEYFMRFVAAYDLSALMKYAGMSLLEAANQVVHKTLSKAGGAGGIIAIDARGNCTMPFNTEGMLRGCITKDGDVRLGIYGT